MEYILSVEATEIDEVLANCGECIDAGESLAPEATYEEGVIAAIGWLLGLTDAHPLDGDIEDGDDDVEIDDSSLPLTD